MLLGILGISHPCDTSLISLVEISTGFKQVDSCSLNFSPTAVAPLGPKSHILKGVAQVIAVHDPKSQ